MPFDEDNPFDEEEVDVEFEASGEDSEPSLEDQITEPASTSRIQKFLDDPWPPATFVLMILGFIIVLFTPVPIWFRWNWTIIGMYFLWILTTVGIVIGLGIWYGPVRTRVRYSGISTILVAALFGLVGTADTLLYIGGGELIAGLGGSLLSLSSMIIVFTLYSLWLVQRVIQNEQKVAE